MHNFAYMCHKNDSPLFPPKFVINDKSWLQRASPLDETVILLTQRFNDTAGDADWRFLPALKRLMIKHELKNFVKKWIYKRTENCINARTCSALLQKFSILFSVDASIKGKSIKFISYHLILIHFNKEINY